MLEEGIAVSMPGLTLWLTTDADQAEMTARFTAAQQSMVHAPHYAPNVLVTEPGFLLGHVNYPEYPVTSFEAENYTVYLEGRVYNKDAVQLEGRAFLAYTPGSVAGTLPKGVRCFATSMKSAESGCDPA